MSSAHRSVFSFSFIWMLSEKCICRFGMLDFQLSPSVGCNWILLTCHLFVIFVQFFFRLELKLGFLSLRLRKCFLFLVLFRCRWDHFPEYLQKFYFRLAKTVKMFVLSRLPMWDLRMQLDRFLLSRLFLLQLPHVGFSSFPAYS